ncbi:MAG TPA: 1-acyl-sn-glycerol-3-phosphate acyltransferase [Egibacteraceae bacterium]|nr:1-acyl-sn-glycerol-3-phosphate acyltransferase [Egibacteraceae bacterium]
MRQLANHRLCRRILAGAGLSALADWLVFSGLVAVVAGLTGGSVFAVALVASARVLPAVVVGPLVAPYAGVAGLRRTLVAADVVRAGAVLLLGVAPSLTGLLVALAALELAGALGSATREAAISAGVEPAAFPALNAATGGLGYGLLPVGGLLAALLLRVHPAAPFAVGAGCYLATAAVMGRTRELDGLSAGSGERVSAVAGLAAVRRPGPLRAVVTAAVIGVVPIVLLFSVADAMAAATLGAGKGRLLALLAAGAVAGGLAAQRGVTATTGLLVACGGAVALLGAGLPAAGGVVGLGAGAGIAYVATQARLQETARAPEEFAAAFAAIKVGTLGALLVAPAVYTVGGPAAVAGTMAALAAVGAGWYAARVDGLALPAHLFRAVARPVLGRACRIRVHGALPAGGAVVVANHPSALDGPLAVWLDRRVRPVAKPQRHLLARAGFALTGTIVRGAGAGATGAAVAHLRRGGLVWLAPTGGVTDDVLGRPRTGAARMAAEAGVPVVVMGILYGAPGSDPARAVDGRAAAGPRLRAWRPWRRPTVRIVLGPPRHVPAGADPSAVSEAFMRELAATTGLRYVGDPAGSSGGSSTGKSTRATSRPSTSRTSWYPSSAYSKVWSSISSARSSCSASTSRATPSRTVRP